jgi:GTPase
MSSLSCSTSDKRDDSLIAEGSISDVSDCSTKVIDISPKNSKNPVELDRRSLNLEAKETYRHTTSSSSLPTSSVNETGEDENDDGDILCRGAESDFGHIEYKYQLLNLSPLQRSKLSNQMKYRINSDLEYGQAVYYIGLTDDGFALGLQENELEDSLTNLREVARQAGARVCDIRRQIVTHYAESEEALVKKYVRVHTGNNSGGKDKTLIEVGMISSDFSQTSKENIEDKENVNIRSQVQAQAQAQPKQKLNLKANILEESKDEKLHYINKEKTELSEGRHRTDSAEVKRREVNLYKANNSNSKRSAPIIRHVAEVLIRKDTEEGYIELRVGIAGNVDSGKSTLLGVLSRGVLDDGRGSARLSVFNYTHEMETGRTSSVAQQIMGFNDRGESVNDVIKIRKPTWEDIVRYSTKILTFFDLCGHERYLRTTISGITSNRPDYAIILVGSNMGLTEMTQEHISLCVAQKIPFIIVMSKIDMAPAPVIKETYREVDYLIKKKFRRMPYKIKSDEDALLCAKKMTGGEIVPIFMASNVDGRGIPQLKLLLNYLPIRRSYTKARARPAKMQVQETFKITGAGTVVGGLLVTGSVKIGDTLLLGPMGGTKHFADARVRSIHCKRVPVEKKNAGSYICVGIPNIPHDKVKTGIFLVSPALNPRAVWEFTAKVYIATSNSTNIRKGYQPFCHIGHIRQTCQILQIVKIVEGRNTRRLQKNRGQKEYSDSYYHQIATEKGKEEAKGNSKSNSHSHQKEKEGEKVDERGHHRKHNHDKDKEQSNDKYNAEEDDDNPEVSIGAGDLATLRMRFCFRPEVIFDEDKQKFVIREGRMRGEGMIINVSNVEHDPISNGKSRRKATLIVNKGVASKGKNDCRQSDRQDYGRGK